VTLALDLKQLRVGYGDLVAVWDVSLQLPEGGTCTLVGRNGAGKTTLLAGIAGALKAMAGSVESFGVDISSLPAHKRARLGVSLVQEGKRVFRPLSVRENLLLGARAAKNRGNRKEIDAVVDEMFDRFPVLSPRARDRAGLLSGGQQQMLAIAQALASRPRVLLFDEPSSGLAPIVVHEVYAILASLKAEGLSMLIVEESLNAELSDLADTMLELERGRVVGSRASTTAHQMRVDQDGKEYVLDRVMDPAGGVARPGDGAVEVSGREP
jgi:branched-chain amino acid transport system ATP-binding protein